MIDIYENDEIVDNMGSKMFIYYNERNSHLFTFTFFNRDGCSLNSTLLSLLHLHTLHL